MKDKDLNFEKALADLENIVQKLEKGGISLSESMGLFEKGVKLARFLRGELEKAEKRVEILLKDESGGARREPFGLEDEESSGNSEGTEEGEPAKKPDEKNRPQSSKKKISDNDDELPF
jgi:exodeoxyribonuclease VII small subunit